jgi:hypothetical protein
MGDEPIVSARKLAHTITEDVRVRTRSLVRAASEDSEALEYGRREMAKTLTLSSSAEETLKVAYRSTGLGLYAICIRAAGMPLERLAMVLNSSQVHGSGQFSQAAKIVFAAGPLAPFRTVGRASIVAWFLQYSVMGCVFQVCDRALSQALGVKPMPYGEELMRPSGQASKLNPQEQVSSARLLPAGRRASAAAPSIPARLNPNARPPTVRRPDVALRTDVQFKYAGVGERLPARSLTPTHRPPPPRSAPPSRVQPGVCRGTQRTCCSSQVRRPSL